jgi:glycerophosphoryl diester phosphodiesterase
MRVYVYAADHPEDIARLQRIGVDGVFTGFPERVIENNAQGADPTLWI